jgi:hypothetical protein
MRRLLGWAAVPALALGLAAGLPALRHEMAPTFAGEDDGATPAASPAASPAATPACPASASPGRVVAVPNEVTIRLTDQGFDPAVIQATSGHDLTVTLLNVGTRPHSFVLASFGIDVELAPGESESFTITPGDRGDAVSYTFVSDTPGDECMEGMLVFYV